MKGARCTVYGVRCTGYCGAGQIVTDLTLAIFCEFHAMIRDHLMDIAVLVAFALSMADQDDHLFLFSLEPW